ncbi:MAG: hypothetical protein ACD_50C00198G0008 [uncultured bacterium]|nr:MAG: hypothetical protein ACD_50C00198G0008 [uncultured bacterium]
MLKSKTTFATGFLSLALSLLFFAAPLSFAQDAPESVPAEESSDAFSTEFSYDEISSGVSSGECTLNGEIVPCDEFFDQMGGFFAWGMGFMIFAGVIGLAATVFWVMMLIHAATKPIENRAMWIILMVFTGVVGALIYYIVVKRHFNSNTPSEAMPGANPSTAPSTEVKTAKVK